MGKALSTEHFALDGMRQPSHPGGENTSVKAEGGLGIAATQGIY